MSTDNVALARSLYGAFRQGDAETVLAHLDPDLEVHDAPGGLAGDDGVGVFHGRDSLLSNLLGEMRSVFSDFQIEAEEFIDSGDRMFVAVKLAGTGAESGAHVEMRAYHVWTYEDQVAKRLQIFNVREQALEAAGAPASGRTERRH